MRNIIGEIVGILVVLASLCILVIGLVKCSHNVDTANWNNGYCYCGGHWRYEQAVGHQYGTSYIYKCDECGNRIEIGTYKEEIKIDETT